MNKFLIFIYLLLPNLILAQHKGIEFQNNLTWKEVQAKAKAENKYILMDCYTSWCVPCKIMEKTVFTDPKLGDFTNERFVSVQVQFDKDPQADEHKKQWMALSKELDKAYGIAGYPCYLFFNANGEIVHKAYGKREVANFMELLNRASNPDKQYYTLRKKYNSNPKDRSTLAKVIRSGKDAEPADYRELLKAFFAGNTEVNSEAEAKIIVDVTRSSRDLGFLMLMKHADKINELIGDTIAQDLYRGIINFEEAETKLGRQSPMGYYILSTTPDWSKYENILAQKYPEHKTEILDFIKLNFYRKGVLMEQYIPALKQYIQNYGPSISNKRKIEYVENIALRSKDQQLLKEMYQWSRDAFEKAEFPNNRYLYAVLIYKIGEKEKAISIMEEALNDVSEDRQYMFKEMLEAMKKGEEI